VLRVLRVRWNVLFSSVQFLGLDHAGDAEVVHVDLLAAHAAAAPPARGVLDTRLAHQLPPALLSRHQPTNQQTSKAHTSAVSDDQPPPPPEGHYVVFIFVLIFVVFVVFFFIFG
jgi:hypothetical protein